MQALLYSWDPSATRRWTRRLSQVGFVSRTVLETIGPVTPGDVLILVNPGENSGSGRGPFDTIRHFRQRLPFWLPVLVVSAGTPASPEKWLESGATDVLSDAIRTADLKMRLHAVARWAQRVWQEAEILRQSYATVTSGLAHDYNNILSAIQGNTDLLLMNPALAGDSRRNLKRISQAAQQAAFLTRQVLESARHRDGVPSALNLNESLRMLRSGMAHAGVGPRVEFKLDRNVPLVRISHAVLANAVMALVREAARCIPAGEGCVEIATGADAQSAAFVEVRAVCAGEAVPIPFDEDALAGVSGGLNESGCKLEMAGAHSARVVFQTPETTPSEANSSATGRQHCGAGTVLLIEEDEAIRGTAHKLLRQEGYTVLEAASGKEGLDLFRNIGGMLDAVIVDLGILGLQGFEVLHHMRDLCPDVRVLVWKSASASEGPGRMNGFAGVTFIEKPAELAEFPGLLSRVLRKG